MGIADYGTAGQYLSSPSLASWAASVATAFNGSDTTVNERIASAVRVQHPNTDDVKVQVYDSGSARWQTAWYDSGWRDVSSLVTAGVFSTLSVAHMRRQNGTVFLHLRGTWNAPTATQYSPIIDPLPTGFAPYAYAQHMIGYIGDTPMAFQTASYLTRLDAMRMTGTSWSAGSTNGHMISWPTSSTTIPTSLPGSLVSAAPAWS